MNSLLIIPSFNEELCIAEVVLAARATGLTVLVVDDGSADNTAALARQAGAIVISHVCNMGLIAAMQTGYIYALAHGYQCVVQLDGDGQHNPAEVTALLAPLQDNSADFVMGSRFLSETGYAMPKIRQMGRQCLQSMLSLFGVKVTDPSSGFWAMRREVLELFLSKDFPEDYPDADVLLLLHRAGFRLQEVPVTMRQSRSGQSLHSGLLHPFRYMLCMLLSVLRVAARKRTTP